MNDNFDKIKEIFESMENDFQKHSEKRNSSAGTRARKSALEMQKLLKIFRKDIQENINAMKEK